jgi:CheY-like chemotaxis protein/anti-sigma regulatory factor (Ser/Thr protein kinase)
MARILVAEDSPDIRELIRMLLESDGHSVTAVPDGRAAVTSAREAPPDLVLMDLSLPILSGWEATRQIRSDPATASVPVLAVTAHAMQGDRERALAAGCDGFIPKPIDEETFARQVASFIGARPVLLTERTRPRALRDEPGRILLVDDQPDVAELVREDLKTDGHTVVVAAGAAQALAEFARDPRFDLAILDVMLGGDSGYALTEALTSRAESYLPVLLVTAGTIDREKAYAVGADDFIGKPIESLELRVRAASLIRSGRLVRERHRNGHERSDAYRKLQELDRMRSDFLSTVSHELRTPLNTIILLAHQLEKTESAPAENGRRPRDVRLLRDAAEALRRMINNILDLAKLEAGQRDVHPEPVVIADLLRETAELLEPQAREKGLDIRVELDPLLEGTVWLDREKLSRVLVNLVSNAVKFTAKGRVLLRAQPWQGSISFEVDDTGIGIPPDLVAAAFEPFRQIRPRNGEAPRGTGLGLTISKQLVEAMGGDLFLDSREGRGTRVTFTVPELPPEPLAAAQPEPVAALAPAERRARVLIVEDDDASRYGLRALLESEGYDVSEASTLQEADARLRHEAPEAVVLDITLPDGDGAVWLTRRGAKETLPCPPVIALTGVTADEDTRRIDAAGVRMVLTKPVNVTQLLLALRELATAKPHVPPAGRRTTREGIARPAGPRSDASPADASGREAIQRGEAGQQKNDE